jgi:hypothetical protein
VIPHILNEVTSLQFKNKTQRISHRALGHKAYDNSVSQRGHGTVGIRRYVRKMKSVLWPLSHPREGDKQKLF